MSGVSHPLPFSLRGLCLNKTPGDSVVFLMWGEKKRIFLLLSMEGKSPADFYSANCRTHNQSSSHMFPLGLQSTPFTLSSLHVSFYILCTLFIAICLFSLCTCAPEPGSCTASRHLLVVCFFFLPSLLCFQQSSKTAPG